MWIVLGTKEKSERVPNGRRFESQCQACGEVAMFYERRVNSTLQLYFLDIVDYGSRLVMACGACGTLYATGDAAQAQPDMISKATKTAGQIGSAMGLLPWESLQKLGLGYAWTLTRLANDGIELAWAAAALVLAAWLGR